MSLKSQLLCQTTNSASLTNNTGALHHHDHSKSYDNSSVKFCAAAISDNLEKSHENANVSPHVKFIKNFHKKLFWFWPELEEYKAKYECFEERCCS